MTAHVRIIQLRDGKVVYDKEVPSKLGPVAVLKQIIALDLDLYKPTIVVLHWDGRVTAISSRGLFAITIKTDNKTESRGFMARGIPRCVVIEETAYAEPIVL
jgi:hypothetical protein